MNANFLNFVEHLNILKTLLKRTLAFCAIIGSGGFVMSGHAFAQATFYQNNNFQGPSFATQRQILNFQRFGFNDRASSAVVSTDRWEVCDDVRFRGRCTVLRPGQYPSLAVMGLNNQISSVRVIGPNVYVDENRYAPLPMQPRLVFYESEGFQGRSFTTGSQIDDFIRYGFNNRASSAVVLAGRWETCDESRFNGRCVVLRPGRYPSLVAMGMNNRVSSVREIGADAYVSDNQYAPFPEQVYDNRPREGERLYLATVTSVRAVMGQAGQRCWIERVTVAPSRPAGGNPNIGGAIVGAVIGGILGHQVGGGTGKDIATAGGAIAGAVAGRNISRNNSGQPVITQDVQRCESVQGQGQPQYWDVTYTFQGVGHQVQMTNPPGSTIRVNAQGEPRA